MTSDRAVAAEAPVSVVPKVAKGVPQFEFEPHNCFACGGLNAHGLHLMLHVEHERAWVELALEEAFEGWAGVTHGGIVCTILDEVMAWSLVGADNWGVTAKMTVAFKRPVPVGRLVRAEGWIARARRRLVETGETLATAEGLYIAADAERKRELHERYGFRLVADTSSATPQENG